MKLILITDRYVPEARAAAYLFRELAEGLAHRGHDVTVLTRHPTGFVPPGQDGVPVSETLNGVAVVRAAALSGSGWVPLRALDQVAVCFRMLWCLLRARNVDAVLVSSPPLPMVLAAVMKKLLHGTPYVIHLHDIYPQTAIDLGLLKNRTLIWLMRQLERIAYLHSGSIIAAAPATMRILRDYPGLPENHATLVHNFVNLNHCAAPGPNPAPTAPDPTFTILYAGLMGYAQDIDLILECARRSTRRTSWRFLLAGDGPRVSQVRDAAEHLPNVQFLGCLPNQQYFEALQAADVCLVALDANLKVPAVPGKVPTIMASGKPLVASVPEGNDTRTVVNEAQCGLVINAGRPTELFDALDWLYRHPQRRSDMGINGRRFAETHFSVEGALVKFERELARVTQNAADEKAANQRAMQEIAMEEKAHAASAAAAQPVRR